MFRNAILISILVLWTPISSAIAAGPQRHAVIIGINNYADPAIPDLKYAEADAQSVYDTLTDDKIGQFPKSNVTLLLGKKATPSNIKAALWKLRGVGKKDLVVVFYSGHGAKEGDEAFWVTQNAQAKALPATALSNADIRKYIARIPSQKLVTFLDCCYAASTVKKSLSDPAKLFGQFAGKGRVTIAGSADSQEALEMPSAKAGVFTHFLVRALSGSADSNEDGAVTFGEVWSYLGQNVRKASVKQGGLHEPVIITESGVTPQFLLTYNPTAKAANKESLTVLRRFFAQDKITGAQYDAGRKALSEPAIDGESRARREVYADLVAGKLAPKYLQTALAKIATDAQAAKKPTASSQRKPTLSVAPFTVLGKVPGKDPGKVLAESILPYFSRRYQLIDQAQLARFCDQDDLTVAGLVQQVQRPKRKGLSKAVKLRAVEYLVVGTISGSPDGTLSVTARICDWQRGTAVGNRFAQVRAESWKQLDKRLALLSSKLLGDIEAVDLGDPNETLPPLPSGVNKLAARIQQLQAIEAELKKARTLYTEKHPRVVKLTKALQDLGKPLVSEIDAKLKELQAADAKLATLYKPAHPKRQALAEQIDALRNVGIAKLLNEGKTLTLKLGNNVTMELVLVPAGTFTMGSPEGEGASDEHPQRRVTISKPFWLGKTEVTQAQYEAVTGKSPWKGKTYAKENPQHAASYVTWNDATAFCQALSKTTKQTVRLPTEAEWEYACRAGSEEAYCFGDDKSKLGDYAWYEDNAWDKGEKYAHPVGKKKPNAWGLHDMHGNVYEWCNDWYQDSYKGLGEKDPKGTNNGWRRVLRGGGWYHDPSHCRSAYRNWYSPVNRYNGNGFRVAVDFK